MSDAWAEKQLVEANVALIKAQSAAKELEIPHMVQLKRRAESVRIDAVAADVEAKLSETRTNDRMHDRAELNDQRAADREDMTQLAAQAATSQVHEHAMVRLRAIRLIAVLWTIGVWSSVAIYLFQ